MNELTALLSAMVARDASDLYLNVDAPPTLRIDGVISAIKAPVLDAKTCQRLIYSALTDQQQAEFESLFELDLSLAYPDIGRFRLNVYNQKNCPAMVVRYIKDTIPSLHELGLPEVLHDLAMEERGLILVVGTAGSGKSTTLASMIDYRNQHQSGHILTVEDPIEFTHSHQRSLISQREVGIDTRSYDEALKHALREAPDVIMIGEVRDYDTAMQALRYAETGHLCLTTLHASTASQAIDRFLNLFPAEVRAQKRSELSHHLQAIVALRLVHSIDADLQASKRLLNDSNSVDITLAPGDAVDEMNKKSRVAAVEILMNTPHIAKLIEAGSAEKIHDAMASGDNGLCQTFDNALYQLAQQQLITEKEAMRQADSRINLGLKFQYDEHSESGEQPTLVSPVGQMPTHDCNENHWLRPNWDFSDYKSIKISSKKRSSERRPEMEQLLDQAIQLAAQERGYQLDDQQPDIILRYAYGLRHQYDMDLPQDNDNLEEKARRGESGLAIKAKDSQTGETLWHMTKTWPVRHGLPNQQEFNIEIAHLFASLPFAGIEVY